MTIMMYNKFLCCLMQGTVPPLTPLGAATPYPYPGRQNPPCIHSWIEGMTDMQGEGDRIQSMNDNNPFAAGWFPDKKALPPGLYS